MKKDMLKDMLAMLQGRSKDMLDMLKKDISKDMLNMLQKDMLNVC